MPSQFDAIAESLSRLVGAPVTLTFGLLLVVHIVGGMTCVLTGAVAFVSRKQRGRHPAVGQVYFWALAVVFVTATGMAVMRWEHSAYLFVLGCVAFAFGSAGYAARQRRWPGWLTMHMLGMSLSYIVLLTAFYVDNGPRLPIWDRLPTIAFWVGPSLIGLPLLARALVRNGRAVEDLRAFARGAAAALSAAWTSGHSTRSAPHATRATGAPTQVQSSTASMTVPSRARESNGRRPPLAP